MGTLTIYMKSGNKIKLRGIKNWKVQERGGAVVGLTIERSRFGIWLGFERLILPSIQLGEIEAITESYP